METPTEPMKPVKPKRTRKPRVKKVKDQNAPKKPLSPWVVHVMKYRAEHPEVSYKQAMTDSKASYHVAKKK